MTFYKWTVTSDTGLTVVITNYPWYADIESIPNDSPAPPLSHLRQMLPFFAFVLTTTIKGHGYE